MSGELAKRRRMAWLAANGPCRLCGSSDQLEVDHVDYRFKTFKASEIWVRSKAIREAELAKCQVLCRTCHQQKTSSEMSERRKGRKLEQEHAPPEVWDVTCSVCSRVYQREARLERYHSKRRKYGPFCSFLCRNTFLSRMGHARRRNSDQFLTTDAEILRLGRAGTSIGEIRKQLHVGRERVKAVLDANNITVRRQGQRNL